LCSRLLKWGSIWISIISAIVIRFRCSWPTLSAGEAIVIQLRVMLSMPQKEMLSEFGPAEG
jgi:hypothetical protein